MLGFVSERLPNRSDVCILGSLLLVSLALNFIGLSWGLPNGNDTWATDALDPMTPLAVAYRLIAEGLNSGWFYFKYPPGHSLLLCGVYAPYLVWLWASGQIGTPTDVYPYGFTDPDRALLVLAMLGRYVSALMTTAAALIWYGACRELLTERAAWFAAWFFATMFPVIYYAHTTNVEAAMIFWMLLALYGAARVYTRANDRLGMIIFAGASAMALSTKEQAIGLLALVPVVLLAEYGRRRRLGAARALLPNGWLAGTATAGALFILLNGILINPLGFWHRIQFLTHTLPEHLLQQYAPYYFPISFGGPKDFAGELAQLRDAVNLIGASVGWPLMAVAALGVMIAGWRRSGQFFLIPAVAYYAITARAMLVLAPRYVLPIAIIVVTFAAIALDRCLGFAQHQKHRGFLSIGIGVLCVFSLMRGVDATRLLLQDTRYAAENWLKVNAADTASIEVYQPATYLPRFPIPEQVAHIAIEERSIARFLSRKPDFVVVSSAGAGNITKEYAADWQSSDRQIRGGVSAVPVGASGDVKSLEFEANRRFLDALQQECLGYHKAARFEARSWIPEPFIPTLAPKIEIYRRSSSVDSSDRCRF
jgi:hypothetical protein